MQYANIIKDQNLRLNNQVEKVLQLARIERGNFELNLEKIDLRETLKAITESVRLNVEKLEGQLEVVLPEETVFIKADKLHFGNILHDLLDNAVKYCNQKPAIRLATSVQDNIVSLIVADNGIGIDKEHQTRIFDKFYRVPTGDVHNVKGFGLGLYYVKNVCNAHGWKLQLNSEPNTGTTIQINIPKIT